MGRLTATFSWPNRALELIQSLVEQPPYSVFVRGIERSVLPAARRYGIGILTPSPLNRGWPTGRYRSGDDIAVTDFKPLIAHKWGLDLRRRP